MSWMIKELYQFSSECDLIFKSPGKTKLFSREICIALNKNSYVCYCSIEIDDRLFIRYGYDEMEDSKDYAAAKCFKRATR